MYEALKTVRWQDENRIQATTQAIFGKSKDESKWSHGGLLLSDVNQAGLKLLLYDMRPYATSV